MNDDLGTKRKEDDPGTERNVFRSPDYCFPDVNGYFGTVGDGTNRVVRYGVGVETKPGSASDVDIILKGVKKSVEHFLITNTFPSVCGLGSIRRSVTGAGGFAFSPSLQQEDLDKTDVECEVQAEGNYCGIYSGEVLVYGSKVSDILPVVEKSLKVTSPRANEINDKLVRVFYVDLNKGNGENTYGENNNGNGGGGGGGGGLSGAAIASIVLCVLAIVIALAGLITYRRKRRLNAMRPDGTMKPPEFIDISNEEGSDLASF